MDNLNWNYSSPKGKKCFGYSKTQEHKVFFKFCGIVMQRGKKVKDSEMMDKVNVCTEVFLAANRAEGIFVERLDCILTN